MYISQTIKLTKEREADDSRFVKAGLPCYYDSKVLNSSFLLINDV